MPFAEKIRELEAAHAGKDEVGHEQIGHIPLSAAESKRSLTA
jgi:hypothetical protein